MKVGKDQVEFREAFISEINEVARLHNELAYFIQAEAKDVYWDFGILSEEEISKHLCTFFNNPERRIYVARDEERVIGFITGEIVQCHLPISSVKKIGYIAGAFVLPEYRGIGVMKRLEGLITGYFKECGIKYAEVNFISQNLIAKKSWAGLGYHTFREQARKQL